MEYARRLLPSIFVHRSPVFGFPRLVKTPSSHQLTSEEANSSPFLESVIGASVSSSQGLTIQGFSERSSL